MEEGEGVNTSLKESCSLINLTGGQRAPLGPCYLHLSSFQHVNFRRHLRPRVVPLGCSWGSKSQAAQTLYSSPRLCIQKAEDA